MKSKIQKVSEAEAMALCKESISLGHGLSFATGRLLVKQKNDDFDSPEDISRLCNVQGLDKNEPAWSSSAALKKPLQAHWRTASDELHR